MSLTHDPLDVILLCVRWYAAYSLSLGNVEEITEDRGFEVDQSSIERTSLSDQPRAVV
jgi:putative transposase